MSREIMQQALDYIKEQREIHWVEAYDQTELELIEALEAELAKPVNEFKPDWDTLKPYHDRIAELEAQLALDKKADNARELGLDYEPEQEPVELKHLRDVHAAQGFDGTWNSNQYMCGLFNGLELALSIFENRVPVYKELAKTEPDHGFDRTASHMAGEYVDTANQEPVAWHSHNPDYPIQDGDWVEVIFTSGQPDDAKKWTPLYTAPQNPDVTLTDEGKTWQGLTSEELVDIVIKHAGSPVGQVFAIETLLREKNT